MKGQSKSSGFKRFWKGYKRRHPRSFHTARLYKLSLLLDSELTEPLQSKRQRSVDFIQRAFHSQLMSQSSRILPLESDRTTSLTTYRNISLFDHHPGYDIAETEAKARFLLR